MTPQASNTAPPGHRGLELEVHPPSTTTQQPSEDSHEGDSAAFLCLCDSLALEASDGHSTPCPAQLQVQSFREMQ